MQLISLSILPHRKLRPRPTMVSAVKWFQHIYWGWQQFSTQSVTSLLFKTLYFKGYKCHVDEFDNDVVINNRTSKKIQT